MRCVASIIVRHNIEVAHRLFDTKGKCEAIHGHSMQVHLEIPGQLDRFGLLDGLEFGAVKKLFRDYLDSTYDHHLLLNENDPWASVVVTKSGLEKRGYLDDSVEAMLAQADLFETLPGLQPVPGDPTTENIAKWIAEWGVQTFARTCEVIVEETLVNAATYVSRPRNGG